jgi:hypothetical protein
VLVASGMLVIGRIEEIDCVAQVHAGEFSKKSVAFGVQVKIIINGGDHLDKIERRYDADQSRRVPVHEQERMAVGTGYDNSRCVGRRRIVRASCWRTLNANREFSRLPGKEFATVVEKKSSMFHRAIPPSTTSPPYTPT